VFKEKKLALLTIAFFFVIANISGRSTYLVTKNITDVIDSLYDAGKYEKCKKEILQSRMVGISRPDSLETIQKLASCYCYLHQTDSAIILLDYLHKFALNNLDIGLSYNHVYYHNLIVEKKNVEI